jgi:CDP-glycerol glycerophosphotransferase
VSDHPLPDHYRRADGQVCVMLWPGVPIRPVGLAAGALGPGQDASDEAIRGVAEQWTHLVSPNASSTEVLRRAFGYAGPVLEVGHPRHDVLADAPARTARAAAVRARLGIPDGARVVLFTPTWFAHLRHPGKVLRLALDVELDRLRAAAGDEAWLLVRSHPEVPDRVGDRATHPKVLDVSALDDLVGLQLAADVAVTHASSLALDTARVGTPLVVYDPADAPIDEQGPLGVDLRRDVPWPVARDAGALLEAVRQLTAGDDGEGDHGTAEVRARHGDVATGGATSAVVDAMLGAGSAD